MLAEARRRFARQDFEAREGEIDSLPLRTGEVDVVLANMVLHHAPDPPRAIREMSRVLKPGGKLVITDADSHEHEWLRTEQHDCWLGFDRAEIARWFREALPTSFPRGAALRASVPCRQCLENLLLFPIQPLSVGHRRHRKHMILRRLRD